MSLSILLLQARQTNDEAKGEERHSFAEMAGIDVGKIVPLDLLKETPTLEQIQRHDALMVGGSGAYYVTKGNLPGFQKLLNVLREVVEVGHPTFASCFGFQLLVEALGGDVVYDPDNMEVGTYQLRLTDEGRRDELFGYLPAAFRAQLGHKDRADRLPSAVLNLASGENAPIQALRVPGKPIWATQFHPELSREENLKRFNRYLDGYAALMSQDELQETLARFDHSPEANELIARFLQLVFP
ncbi:MAG: type 1 glutamine amidotransferase [Chloroflexota bacterium]|nr:MAG: type 1 glutamine amidotransferase [Chloroflexota bacterium]